MSKRGLAGLCEDFRVECVSKQDEKPACWTCNRTSNVRRYRRTHSHKPTRPHLLILPGGQAMVTAVQNQCSPGHPLRLLKRSVLTFIQYSYPTGQPPTAHFIRYAKHPLSTRSGRPPLTPQLAPSSLVQATKSTGEILSEGGA